MAGPVVVRSEQNFYATHRFSLACNNRILKGFWIATAYAWDPWQLTWLVFLINSTNNVTLVIRDLVYIIRIVTRYDLKPKKPVDLQSVFSLARPAIIIDSINKYHSIEINLYTVSAYKIINNSNIIDDSQTIVHYSCACFFIDKI